MVKDFQLAGIQDLIIDVSLRHEFYGSCLNHMRNGEASHADANGELDAAVKAKLDNYQHDYNERNFFFLPAVMTTSGRISCDFLRLLYILSDRQAHRQLLFTHGPPRPLHQGFQTAPRLLLLLQPCRHRQHQTNSIQKILSTLTPSISSWDRQQRRMMVCLSLGQEACSGV